MNRNPDAAAHDDAIDQRDVRLRVTLDDAVEPVFLAIEIRGQSSSLGSSGIVKSADIAAGTEGPLTRALNHDATHGRIAGPGAQLRVQRAHHAEGQGIQGLGPVQRDQADAVSRLEQDVVHLNRQAAAARRSGA